MAGRNSRSRLLATSLVVLGGVFACGGTSQHRGGTAHGGAAGASTHQAGGSASTHEGGRDSGASEAIGGTGGVAVPGGSGGTGGLGGLSSACPVPIGFCDPPPQMQPCPGQPPAPGDNCLSPLVMYPPSCTYDVPECGPIVATCAAAVWSLSECDAGGAGGQAGAGGEGGGEGS